jgi:preprotein translocase subunit Sec63
MCMYKYMISVILPYNPVSHYRNTKVTKVRNHHLEENEMFIEPLVICIGQRLVLCSHSSSVEFSNHILTI